MQYAESTSISEATAANLMDGHSQISADQPYKLTWLACLVTSSKND
jgi:hypothetical protein